jgi:hypothetical protein
VVSLAFITTFLPIYSGAAIGIIPSLGADDQEETFSFPANGSTYTFQVEQVDNHPAVRQM